MATRGRFLPTRLSTYYLFHFGALGALVPYWGPYLKTLGFSSAEIGELIAILLGTKIVAPNVWGWIADRGVGRMQIIRLAGFIAAAGFAALIWAQSYWPIAASLLVFSFFWNAALPQFEANTLNHLAPDVERYGRIRLWGSVGFILTVLSVGPVLDRWGDFLLPRIVLGLLAGLWLAAVLVPDAGRNRERPGHSHLGRVLRRPQVIALFVVCFLVQASHGPYYGFFSIYMGMQGYTGGQIGALWALGVIAEVLVFLFAPRLFRSVGPRRLMLGALAATAARWLMIGYFADNIYILLIAQSLHLASFGIYHAVAVHYIHHYFTGRLQGRGQALYSSLSFGAGGAAGSLYSGYVWDAWGPAAVYAIAGLAGALALLIGWRGLSDPESDARGGDHEFSKETEERAS